MFICKLKVSQAQQQPIVSLRTSVTLKWWLYLSSGTVTYNRTIYTHVYSRTPIDPYRKKGGGLVPPFLWILTLLIVHTNTNESSQRKNHNVLSLLPMRTTAVSITRLTCLMADAFKVKLANAALVTQYRPVGICSLACEAIVAVLLIPLRQKWPLQLSADI